MAFATVLGDLSTRPSSLTLTAEATAGARGITFDARSTAGLVVHEISAALLNTRTAVDVLLAGDQTVVINVSGEEIRLRQNFNTDADAGARIIWNFDEAANLRLDNRFVGAVLAPGAALRATNGLFGSVAVAPLDQQGHIHQVGWAGILPVPGLAPIPLPAAGWMLMAGMAGLGLLWLRRGARARQPHADQQASVAEMPHTGEHHRQPARIGRRNHLFVAHRAAGLDHRRHPGLGHHL